MYWTKIYWQRKYHKYSLPQMLFKDPDWFFYKFREGHFEDKGPIANEAEDLNLKARNIRIPMNEGEDLVAEYGYRPNPYCFENLELVPRHRTPHSGATGTERMNVIDMSYPSQLKGYDKLGGNLLLSDLKSIYFGSAEYRMTKRRCEAFYEDDDNFDIKLIILKKKVEPEEIAAATECLEVAFEKDNSIDGHIIHEVARDLKIPMKAMHIAKSPLRIKLFRKEKKWIWCKKN